MGSETPKRGREPGGLKGALFGLGCKFFSESPRGPASARTRKNLRPAACWGLTGHRDSRGGGGGGGGRCGCSRPGLPTSISV